MKHLVIKDSQLNGWEYGMLRSFETAIVKETDATQVELPKYNLAPRYLQNFGHGMKLGIYRKYFPCQEFELQADVAWCILMGPENYQLDLFKNWNIRCKTKILYLFDTLPAQYPLIKRLFSNNIWDILITSFNDAVADLENITGRKWHSIEQAADIDLFKPVPVNDRLIHFSSYGRRYPEVHLAIKDFCVSNGLCYDYTTHDGKHPVVDSTELYRQYAWHLSHSLFTLSWPVELTNPSRAGHLHPITCRWFEAAASGTVLIGKKPNNDSFNKSLENSLVLEISPDDDKTVLFKKLENIWFDRNILSLNAIKISERNFPNWSWNDRVNKILKLM